MAEGEGDAGHLTWPEQEGEGQGEVPHAFKQPGLRRTHGATLAGMGLTH